MVNYGSALFWVLISGAVLVALTFIVSVIRRWRLNKLLSEPLPESQNQVLYSAAQLEALRQLLADTGYAYDGNQNVFYSVMYPWQRKLGYCRLYDVSSAAVGMVIDSEPIYFDYGGRKWMIELWKGQYGITTGAEIGVYNTTGPDLNIPGIFNGTFYFCAGDEDTLSMTYTLIKKDKVLFSRAGRHWWLTGFRLGEYAKPSWLTMEASITFKDGEMQSAFLEGLRKTGYTQDEIRYSGNTVLILFTKPHSRQPFTRHGLVAWLALRYNKRNVGRYRSLTKGLDNMYDILTTLKDTAPLLYSLVMNMGRPKKSFKVYDKLQPYLERQ
jgi:hypothetical protein